MEYQKTLWPFTREVVCKAIKRLKDEGKGGPEIDAIKDTLEEIFLSDPEISTKINDLVEKELKVPPPEPRSAISLSAFIRPLITAALTGVFCYLIFKYATIDTGKVNQLKDALIVFLGIYGPIIGFWFGEKTALKMPGKQQ